MSLPHTPATGAYDSGDPLELLQTVFGYSAFRHQQAAVIDAAMAGQDTLVLMPTGGGKSLCYQIPAMARAGVGIVVSPLIALMQDQVAALTQLGVRAAFLNSTLGSAEQASIIAALRRGELDLLYAAPERLAGAETRSLLASLPISLIAIDEAHCVSQWGHDFRQDYLALAELGALLPGVPRMALTATATPETRREIEQRLELQSPARFISSFDRPNIRYQVSPRTEGRSQLKQFLAPFRGQAGIVYCLSRRKVEQTADWLVSEGFNALPYHAGLPAEMRTAHQQRFLRDDGVVMVATIAFGMGIDKPDVRFVAHLDLPKSLESYYQETGRAGRDGEPADAFMVYGLQDVVRLKQMASESSADEQYKRRDAVRLDALLGWCENIGCRRTPLLAYFGEGYEGPCGNCDNCLNPPTTFDATEPARMLLSAVYRSGQRFGAAHVIDILRGQQNDRIRQWDHDQLSVFGIGTGLDVRRWRSLVRQLIVQGDLFADSERFGALTLTRMSRPLLRGETQLFLRQETPSADAQTRSSRTGGSASREEASFSDRDLALWETLRAHRKALAESQQVPPYVIFHDATLRQMVQRRPRSEAELLAINGIGQAKLDRYGHAFLDLIVEFEAAE